MIPRIITLVLYDESISKKTVPPDPITIETSSVRKGKGKAITPSMSNSNKVPADPPTCEASSSQAARQAPRSMYAPVDKVSSFSFTTIILPFLCVYLKSAWPVEEAGLIELSIVYILS